jgi:hypothetical protein
MTYFLPQSKLSLSHTVEVKVHPGGHWTMHHRPGQ